MFFFVRGAVAVVNVINRDGGQSGLWSILTWPNGYHPILSPRRNPMSMTAYDTRVSEKRNTRAHERRSPEGPRISSLHAARQKKTDISPSGERESGSYSGSGTAYNSGPRKSVHRG